MAAVNRQTHLGALRLNGGHIRPGTHSLLFCPLWDRPISAVNLIGRRAPAPDPVQKSRTEQFTVASCQCSDTPGDGSVSHSFRSSSLPLSASSTWPGLLANMISICPDCGSHLSIVRAQDASHPSLDTAPVPKPRGSQRPTKAKRRHDDTNPGVPGPGFKSKGGLDSNKNASESKEKDQASSKKRPNSRKQDLQMLMRLICFGPMGNYGVWGKRPTFRPYLCPQFDRQGKPERPWTTLHRATAKMHTAIHRAGEQSAESLLASRRAGARAPQAQRGGRRKSSKSSAPSSTIWNGRVAAAVASPRSRTPRHWPTSQTPSCQISS